VVAIGSAVLFFCAVSAQAATIKYVGSSTVGKFITDASQVYVKAKLKLDTRPESSGGESCATRGKCDIGGVARELKDSAVSKGVHATLIGKDAIGVIVHKDNPVQNLSSEQLK